MVTCTTLLVLIEIKLSSFENSGSRHTMCQQVTTVHVHRPSVGEWHTSDVIITGVSDLDFGLKMNVVNHQSSASKNCTHVKIDDVFGG